MQKERQSNIELLRIVAMLLVLAIHANFWRLGVPTACDALTRPSGTFVRIVLQFLSAPCVDVFILISGYFSIQPKVKGICNLWFLLAFWGGVAALYDQVSLAQCARQMLFPFLGWFISAYLGLYLVSPILNKYAEHENGVNFGRYVVLFFLIEFVFDILFPYCWVQQQTLFNRGYSVLSFVPLYLLGRYLRLYRPVFLRRDWRCWASLYVGIFCAAAVIVFILLRCSECSLLASRLSRYFMRNVCAYTSPITIVGSVFLFFWFESLKFSSRLVNRIAASALGVFCFHSMSFYAPVVRSIYRDYTGVRVLMLEAIFIVCVYVIGTLIDQCRRFVWEKGVSRVFRR